MRQESLRHVLGVAVRIDDHFIERPIDDELDVRIDGVVLPTQVQSGGRRRHDDGTYRFVDLSDGTHQLQIRSPDDRWMLLDPLPVIVTPLGPPPVPVKIDAWPTPIQATPLGITAIRGKLVGTPAATIGRRIEIAIGSPAVDSGHHTRTSSLAEFLFLLPGRLELDADGLVDLAIDVVGNTVAGGEVVTGETTTSFSGAAFKLAPGSETRVRFFVT